MLGSSHRDRGSSLLEKMFAVLHIPHASRYVPDDVRKTILLSDDELDLELLLLTDHFTDRLFDCSSPIGASIVYPVSRLVADPERFENDSDEPMASRGMGVIYIRTSDNRVLREAPSAQERERLIGTYYEPHHLRLSEAVAGALGVHGYCLIVDCHSFPSRPLPYELDQSLPRPDVCIGTDAFHTPGWLRDAAVSRFRRDGLATAVDRPFSGTIVPKPYYRQNRAVLSVMIEINRSLYMDETSGTPGTQLEAICEKLESALRDLLDVVLENSSGLLSSSE